MSDGQVRLERPASVEARLGRAMLILVLAVLTGALIAGLALPVVGSAGLAVRSAIGNITFADLPPELQQPPLSQRSVILAADGSELATFYYENRQSVDLADVNPVMRQAIVAIEDSRFYEHHGIDPKGIARALVKDSSTGGAAQGASTITQQYVRQALVETNAQNNDTAAAHAATAKTLTRKLTEARYALALEQKLSKDQILEDYLNTVYFGSGAYGVAAAAQHYFSDSPSDLTLAQAALLSGIINNPSVYDPIVNPHDATDRRNTVLQRMADLHYISQAEATKAIESPLGLKVADIPNGCTSSKAPFFCQYVVAEVLANPAFGKTTTDRRNLLLRGGLTISTTLNTRMQAAAQAAVNNVIPPDPTQNAGLAAAIDMVQPKTGAVLAMAVDRTFGPGFGQDEDNYAADEAHGSSIGRHAGSTFKIFVLASALKQGIPTGTTLNSPVSITIPKGSTTTCDGSPTDKWQVHNAGDSESGVFDMVRGTAQSVNTYFAQLEVLTGLCDPVQIAESVGVRQATGAPLEQVPTFVLGAEDVDPLTVANAYATFAAHGMYCAPEVITKLSRQIGNTTSAMAVPPPNCKQVLDPGVADGVTSLLQNVLKPGGTGAAEALSRAAAGKTGTDDNYQNGWFTGYTPNLAASVWTGYPDAVIPMRNITVNGHYIPEVFGATLAGPIWKQAMEGALIGLPVLPFAQAPSLILKGSPITVPDFTGKDPTAAEAALTKLRLVPTIDPTQVNSTQAAGSVASTNPAAGTILYAGQKVVIEVSNGTPPPASPPASAPASAPGSSSPSPPESPSPKPSHGSAPPPLGVPHPKPSKSHGKGKP